MIDVNFTPSCDDDKRACAVGAGKLISESLFKRKNLYLVQSRLYLIISPGLHSNTLHIASSVEKRIAFAFPLLSIDRFASVIPIA